MYLAWVCIYPYLRVIRGQNLPLPIMGYYQEVLAAEKTPSASNLYKISSIAVMKTDIQTHCRY